MSEPHFLVLVSVVSLVFLGIFLGIYRYIFPKRKLSLFVTLILISILPVISLIRPGTYESGDLTFHTIETMVFFKSLTQGIIFPIWAGDMNYTYGYPAFLFFYPLPFYLSSILHFIGFSFLDSVKIVLAIAYVLSGAFMFLWLKKKTNELGAFVGGLFYLFAPYHFVDLHFRVAMGEVLALAIIPLALLAAENFIQTNKNKWVLIEIFAIAFLIMSHPAVSLSALALIFILMLHSIFFLSNRKEKVTSILRQLSVFIIGIALTSFYLIPVIFETKFTQAALYTTRLSYIEFTQLLYSPWRWGLLFQGPYGQLSFLLGYAQLTVIFLIFIFIFKKRFNKFDKLLVLIALFITLSSVFMMLRISAPIWQTVPLINNFQFTYRLLAVCIFAVSVLAAVLVKNMKNKVYVYGLCFFVIIVSILNWGNRKNLPNVNDQVLVLRIESIVNNGGGLSQAVTKWSNPSKTWATNPPKQHLEIIDGRGKVIQVNREIVNHTYLINAQTNLKVRENTLFFPGWTLLVNNKKQPIIITKDGHPRGVIEFIIPQGLYKVELYFRDTMPRKIGKLVTIGAFFGLIIFILINNKNIKFGKNSLRKRN